MQEKPNAFDNALSNFTFGMANKDLICHMAAEGYSVRQIKEATDYPVSLEKIAETVWEYYIETGVLRMIPPGEDAGPKYDYVMDIGKYGKRSFRRIERKNNPTDTSDLSRTSSIKDSDKNNESKKQNSPGYIQLDIGIIKAHDPEKYEKLLQMLDSRKRDYIDGLPWPDAIVWHVDNLTIREIMGIWSESE